MLYKDTRSLFLGQYQYKVVLVCPGAHLMRGGDFDGAIKTLSESLPVIQNRWMLKFKGPDEIELAKSMCLDLKKLVDFNIRVETPYVNVYTNNVKDVNFFEKKYSNNIKYISKPIHGTELEEDTIFMPKMNFDYKITIGATRQEYTAFVDWASVNAKVKLTKSCIRDLNKNRSWGGTHFYITGSHNLLLAKMHLGSSISKVQRIIKQSKD